MELTSLHEILSENIEFNPYASKLQYNEKELVLTRIKEKQITSTKLLGSGTFGKVKSNFLLFKYILEDSFANFIIKKSLR